MHSLYFRYQDIYFDEQEYEEAFTGVKNNKVYDQLRRQNEAEHRDGGTNAAGETHSRPVEPGRQEFTSALDRHRYSFF